MEKSIQTVLTPFCNPLEPYQISLKMLKTIKQDNLKFESPCLF